MNIRRCIQLQRATKALFHRNMSRIVDSLGFCGANRSSRRRSIPVGHEDERIYSWPILISAADAREAEQEARKQRLEFGYLLRAEESKAPTSADIMRIRRMMATGAERSVTYDNMLSEPDTQRPFNCGALYFDRPSD
jgi:hypothetical protein